jgi:hypothetical protein
VVGADLGGHGGLGGDPGHVDLLLRVVVPADYREELLVVELEEDPHLPRAYVCESVYLVGYGVVRVSLCRTLSRSSLAARA